jgi:hypothetical protein
MHNSFFIFRFRTYACFRCWLRSLLSTSPLATMFWKLPIFDDTATAITTALYVPCERTVVQPCSGQTLITKHEWQCAMQKNKLQSTQETGPHNKSLGFNNNILYIINCKTFSFFNICSFCYTLKKPKCLIIWREREREREREIMIQNENIGGS